MPSVTNSNNASLERQIRRACINCSLSELCVPVGLNRNDVERLESVVERSGPKHTGDHLYRVGEQFHTLFVVRSGCFKNYRVDSEGRDRVLGFFLPGEIMGLDAIYPGTYQSDAVSLDTGSVCALPYEELTLLASQIPRLQDQIMRLLSKDLSNHVWLAGDSHAEERLAGFLIDLSNRFRERGYSDREFVLAMSRRDIANFLRLATETVSRVFTRFEKEGLIEVNRRDVKLLDMAALAHTARCVTRFV